jgi:hypothetical protein
MNIHNVMLIFLFVTYWWLLMLLFDYLFDCLFDCDFVFVFCCFCLSKMSANVNEIAQKIIECFSPSIMIHKLTITNGFIDIFLKYFTFLFSHFFHQYFSFSLYLLFLCFIVNLCDRKEWLLWMWTLVTSGWHNWLYQRIYLNWKQQEKERGSS